MTDSSQRTRPPARPRLARAALAALALVCAFAVAPAQGPPPSPVRVDAVREELVQQQRRVVGSLRALRRSRVATQEAGLVVEMLAREGGLVAAGDLLLRLDATRLELELARLDAEREVARASLAERESDAAQKRNDLAALEELARRDAANQKELWDARTALLSAEARAEQARQHLEVLAADRALLHKRIADMEIHAPFAGVVASRYAEAGEWLGEGAAVLELVSTSELEAWLEVPQADLAALRAHAGPIRVEIDATGQVLSLAEYRPLALIDLAARTFPVIAAVPAGEGLAPGMSLTAEIPTAVTAPHLTVAQDAILRNEVGPFVYVAVPGAEGAPHQALPMPVRILFRTRERAVVSAPGLAPGTLVVVEGNERLYPTAPIRPLDAASEGGAREDGASEGERGASR